MEQCNICYTTIKNKLTCPFCGEFHNHCLDCLKNMVPSTMIMDDINIFCYNCNYRYTVADIMVFPYDRYIEKATDLYINRAKEIENYKSITNKDEQKRLMNLITGIKDTRSSPCYNLFCSGSLVNSGNNQVCSVCHEIYCGKCYLVIEEKHICSSEKIYICPKCYSRGVKIGCPHITCVYCKYDFYENGSPYYDTTDNLKMLTIVFTEDSYVYDDKLKKFVVHILEFFRQYVLLLNNIDRERRILQFEFITYKSSPSIFINKMHNLSIESNFIRTMLRMGRFIFDHIDDNRNQSNLDLSKHIAMFNRASDQLKIDIPRPTISSSLRISV